MRTIADTEADPGGVGDVLGVIEKFGKVTSIIMRPNEVPHIVNFVPAGTTGGQATGRREEPRGYPSALSQSNHPLCPQVAGVMESSQSCGGEVLSMKLPNRGIIQRHVVQCE